LDGVAKPLQATAERLATGRGWENLWVVTSSQLALGVREQLPQLPVENLGGEGRDTAPAVGFYEVAKRCGGTCRLFPADPWIGDQLSFKPSCAAQVADSKGDRHLRGKAQLRRHRLQVH